MEACWTKTLHWAAPFEQISDSDNAVGKGGGGGAFFKSCPPAGRSS